VNELAPVLIRVLEANAVWADCPNIALSKSWVREQETAASTEGENTEKLRCTFSVLDLQHYADA